MRPAALAALLALGLATAGCVAPPADPYPPAPGQPQTPAAQPAPVQ